MEGLFYIMYDCIKNLWEISLELGRVEFEIDYYLIYLKTFSMIIFFIVARMLGYHAHAH